METVYKYALVVLLLVVLFNLGQALYFMMTDRDGSSRRTAWALTRRIGLSILLILMVMLGIWMGWLHPHGVDG